MDKRNGDDDNSSRVSLSGRLLSSELGPVQRLEVLWMQDVMEFDVESEMLDGLVELSLDVVRDLLRGIISKDDH